MERRLRGIYGKGRCLCLRICVRVSVFACVQSVFLADAAPTVHQDTSVNIMAV